MKGTLVYTVLVFHRQGVRFFGVSEKIRTFDRREMADGSPFLKKSHGQRKQYEGKLILLPRSQESRRASLGRRGVWLWFLSDQ